MSEYREPQYLTNDDQPIDRVRCPVHGFIRYSINERHVIDSPAVRRLRFIKQLGLTEYAYPGANHTRFEHSLGVMEMASAMFDSLSAKKGETIENELRSLPWYAESPLGRARQVVRLAALLHDTGHPPFSHGAEKLWAPDGHEELSIRLISDVEGLGSLLDQTWGEGMANQVASLLAKDQAHSFAPQLLFLKNIISGEIDADRADYLLRDSHHCGVEYGRFDQHRLVQCLTLEATSGGLEIAVGRDGIHTVEALILARFQMNAQVYFHRIRRIYDHLIVEYHHALDKSNALEQERVLELNDIQVMAKAFEDAKTSPEGWESAWSEHYGDHEEENMQIALRKRAFFARRILDRKHPRIVYESGDNADLLNLKEARDIAEILKNEYTDVYIVLDDMAGKRVGIHKIYVPNLEDMEGVVLKVIGKDNIAKQIGEESRILSKIPKSFMCVRIFADAKSEEQRLEIEARVRQLRNEQ